MKYVFSGIFFSVVDRRIAIFLILEEKLRQCRWKYLDRFCVTAQQLFMRIFMRSQEISRRTKNVHSMEKYCTKYRKIEYTCHNIQQWSKIFAQATFFICAHGNLKLHKDYSSLTGGLWIFMNFFKNLESLKIYVLCKNIYIIFIV